VLRGLLALVVLAALTAPLAAGHPSPPGCTQDAFSFDWGPGLNIVHRNGDVVTINALVGNDNIGSGICKVTNATVTLIFPNPDGTSNGQEFVLATGVTFPAGAPKKSFGKRNLTVGFDPGVFRGFVTIKVEGTVHAGTPDSPTTTTAGRPLVISRPHVTFDVSATPTVSPPFTVQYDYSAENDSPSDPAGEISNPTPEVLNAKVTDDNCSPIDFTGGDTTISDPPIVNKGETWTYTCTRPLPLGSLVDVATFTGSSTRDGRPWPKRTVVTAFCGRLPATIVGTDKANTITGTAGQDVIVARGGDDVISGLGGDDIICGGAGDDELRGNSGADILRGEGGDDKLVGGAGIDSLVGGPGHDTLVQ
jgi:Ca2+-binding RTX toxin-like protein